MKDWRQLDYEAKRADWRPRVDNWLAERDLPGTPMTKIDPDWTTERSSVGVSPPLPPPSPTPSRRGWLVRLVRRFRR